MMRKQLPLRCYLQQQRCTRRRSCRLEFIRTNRIEFHASTPAATTRLVLYEYVHYAITSNTFVHEFFFLARFLVAASLEVPYYAGRVSLCLSPANGLFVILIHFYWRSFESFDRIQKSPLFDY